MESLLPVILSDDLRRFAHGVRLHVLRFEGARIGVGHRGLDLLRSRVLTRLRHRLESEAGPAPEIAALDAFLEATGQDPRRDPSLLVRLVRAVARRTAFPVENDARDVARLLSLYHLAPVFLLDADAIAAPLVFLPCPERFVLPTPEGPLQAPGAPVLADAEKALRSLQHEVRRAAAHEQSRRLLLVLVDVHAQPLRHERVVQRAENWMTSLTSARLVEEALSA